jgi:hypothetical protein
MLHLLHISSQSVNQLLCRCFLPLFFSFFLLSLFIIAGCERDSTPFSPWDYHPSHDFEWVADTLAPPGVGSVYMYDIWGTDQNNVWTVGGSAPVYYQIWHWNGKHWYSVEPKASLEIPTYQEIFGFSEKDFWIVGYISNDMGYLLHYDGSWQRVNNNELSLCNSIWGTSSQNIFIGCNKGLIFKYNGQEFIRYETGRNLQITTIWGLRSGEVFATGVNNDNQPAEPPIRYLFRYESDQFILVDSLIRTNPGDETIGMDLWGTDLNNFYSPTGSSLTKYVDGKWVTQFYAPLWRVFGSSPNNVFAAGYNNTFYHYNGTDWAQVYPIDEEVYGGIWALWCCYNYVFAVQHTANFTRILRGKNSMIERK